MNFGDVITMKNYSFKWSVRFCKRLFLFSIIVLGTMASGVTSAVADFSELRFVNLNKKRPQVALRCNLYLGNQRFARVTVLGQGQRLRLPPAAKRKAIAVRSVAPSGQKKFRSWACLFDESGQNNLLVARAGPNSEPVVIAISVEDFPVASGQGGSANTLGQKCGRTQSFPSAFIYKRVGSSHFNDCRRNTAGLIIKAGYPGSFPSSAEVLDTRGNVRAVLGAYFPSGHEWKWRGYACWGAGKSTPFSGSKIAADARSSTGSSNVYLKLGNTCYGPIDAGRCYNSSQC